MSDHQDDEVRTADSSDELVSLLVQRSKRGRARSTSVLIGVLLLLLGVLVGVGLGRATAPQPVDGEQSISQQDDGPRRGPFSD